jgi:RND family efflux transporter MFP subunit
MEKDKPSKFKKILKKKRTWAILILVLILAGFFLFRPNENAKNTVTDTVKYIDLKQTVLATGQVVSKTDLDLSFNTSGIVRQLKVQVGDTVKEGQILATLDQGAELAALTQARGALAAAEARYQKTLDGASNEEIALAQVALDQTRLTQETLVKNAYHSLLNSTPEALPEEGTDDYTAPTISGSYNGEKEGIIKIDTYLSSGGSSFQVSGLTTGNGMVTTMIPQPIGSSGLYITFPSSVATEARTWIITLPNKKASDYLTNYNAYQAALSNAQSAIDQKTAELALKKAQARPSDINLAKADIITAQGQMQAAQARYENTVIRAPASGTITRVDVKLGELAQALKEVLVLQDISNIYLEANINEANIAHITVGMPIDVTYDAFGSETPFKGTIAKIDPSSTLVSGVVNYKVTASVEQGEALRPGMTANMTIKVKEKNHILAIPSRAIITSKTGERMLRVITDTKTKKFKEVPVTTGLEGDGGMTEVVSGVASGDEFVVLIKV